MSTSYYYLKPPISSIRLEEGPGHDRLTIWEKPVHPGVGANVGTLTVTLGRGREFARMLADDSADDWSCPMRTHFGGKGVGCVVTENVRGLDPALVLVSKDGEVLTVAQIRAFAGGGA